MIGTPSTFRSVPAAVALSTLLASPIAWADDSVAPLDTGGLVLEKTDKIALVSEELYLSPKAVKITYRFRNLTDADCEALIAFPMPTLTGGEPDNLVDIPDPTHDNFLKFSTEVDGKPLQWKVEQRAFIHGREGMPDEEITDKLKALKVPLLPTVEATEKAINALGEADRRGLADAGIVKQDSDNADDKGQRYVYPRWTLYSKFLRKQVFPAHGEIVVRQDYVPSTGGVSWRAFGNPDLAPGQKRYYEKTYCTDAAFIDGAQARYKRETDAARSHPTKYQQYLRYVMTADSNWTGPIGDYRLVVDGGNPDTLVSFCGEGVTKIGPATFEMRAKDFVPKMDIKVLLLVNETRQ